MTLVIQDFELAHKGMVLSIVPAWDVVGTIASADMLPNRTIALITCNCVTNG